MKIRYKILDIVLVVALLTAVTTGCSSGRKPQAQMQTATEELKTAEPNIAEPVNLITMKSRAWPMITTYYHHIAVKHPAIYMQDYFERWNGSAGAYLTWRNQDIGAVVSGPAQFLANTITLPIAAVITPPWQVQYSRSNFPLAAADYEIPYPADRTNYNDPQAN